MQGGGSRGKGGRRVVPADLGSSPPPPGSTSSATLSPVAALAGAAGSISCERTRSDAVVLLLCRVAVPCDTELMGRVLGLA